jgi:hypothetical protein
VGKWRWGTRAPEISSQFGVKEKQEKETKPGRVPGFVIYRAATFF